MFNFILLFLIFIMNIFILDLFLFWTFGDKKMFIVMIWEYFFNKKK